MLPRYQAKNNGSDNPDTCYQLYDNHTKTWVWKTECSSFEFVQELAKVYNQAYETHLADKEGSSCIGGQG